MRTERANAKINLYLNVISKRENGYHDLKSIMQTVSLCDLVTVDFHPASHTEILLQASGAAQMPLDCRNLAWRAAERYAEATKIRGKIRIFIEKHIPMAAGLAGGSADAAAVLRGLNRLCGDRLNTDELCAVGTPLGADIPFCIVGGTSFVTGIGESLKELPSVAPCFLTVACAGEGVSTPWAYGKLDASYGNFAVPASDGGHLEPLLNSLRNASLPETCAHLFNLFEEVVPPVRQNVCRLREIMVGSGAMGALMSGSGPSVFGMFQDRADAETACNACLAEGAAAFVCHPVGRQNARVGEFV